MSLRAPARLAMRSSSSVFRGRMEGGSHLPSGERSPVPRVSHLPNAAGVTAGFCWPMSTTPAEKKTSRGRQERMKTTVSHAGPFRTATGRERYHDRSFRFLPVAARPDRLESEWFVFSEPRVHQYPSVWIELYGGGGLARTSVQ